MEYSGVGWGGGPRLEAPGGRTGPQKARAGVVSPPPSLPPHLTKWEGLGPWGQRLGRGLPQGVLPTRMGGCIPLPRHPRILKFESPEEREGCAG